MKNTCWLFFLLVICLFPSCQWLPEVGSVRLSDSEFSLTVGSQRTITATVEPDVADYDGIVWASSDPKVASVVDGTVRGVRDGVTQITATASGVTSLPCSVTVRSIRVSSVSINKTSAELTVGQAIKLEASINPQNATNQTIFWSSSDVYVATVSNAGLVVSQNPGTATITLRSDDGDHTATCKVTVKSKVIDVTGITLSQSSVSVKEEATVQLKATVKPSNATNQEVSWSSGDDGIATIASDGTVTGITEGTTTITAKSADGKVTATCKVTVTAEYVEFADANFRQYILDNYDLNRNGKLSLTEAASIKRIEVNTDNIKSLQGIEYMSALSYLECAGNTSGSSGKLTQLDVSHNIALSKLICSYNRLMTLDVSNNTALTYLDCSFNQLPNLDVSKNTALIDLRCWVNQLTTLDVSKNTSLRLLECESNQLTTLDVSKNTSLSSLYCSNNQLTTLDVSMNTALTQLWCTGNQLTTLDVTKHTALRELLCSYNRLTTLDVSRNTALTQFWCARNQLTSLDVSKNTALTQLICYSNRLTSLDVSKNKSLTYLDCSPMSTLKTLYVSSGQSIDHVTTNRSTSYVPAGTSIVTK